LDKSPFAFGYIRVSSERQHKFGASEDAQEKDCVECYQRYQDSHDWGGIFADPAKSAYKLDFIAREAGYELNTRLENGDILIMSKVDRCFRNMKDQAVMMSDWKDRGIILVSATEGWSTADPFGKIVAYMMGAIAERESERRGERIRESNAIRKAKGQPHTGIAPTGFIWAGTPGKRFLKRRLDDQLVMEKIYEWRRKDNVTFEAIWSCLRRQRISHNFYGRAGEWSLGRVISAYYMEIFLRWLDRQNLEIRNIGVTKSIVQASAILNKSGKESMSLKTDLEAVAEMLDSGMPLSENENG
jgi:DNA invertase Pin-like site-specific DNA recombinase